MKTSCLRDQIEEKVWEEENPIQKAENFRDIAQTSKIPPASKRKMINSITILLREQEQGLLDDINLGFKIDSMATNCMLKFEGQGVVGALPR